MKRGQTIGRILILLCTVTILVLMIPGCGKKPAAVDATDEEKVEEVKVTDEKTKKEVKRKLVYIRGYVTFVLGKVEVIDSKGKVIGAEVKTPVRGGDTVRTYDEATCYMQVGPQSIIKVFANSELKVDLLIRNYRTNVTLMKGKTYTKIIRKLDKGESFNVRTPTAVASVRGTEFLTESTAEKTTLYVATGKVAVYKDSRKPVIRIIAARPDATVNTGSFTVIEKKKKPVVKKQTDIQVLEVKKAALGTQIIPSVHKQTKEYIEKFHLKSLEKEEEVEKKIERGIQDIKNVENPVVVLELTDGSKLKGYIVEQDETMLKLDDGTDVMSIPKKDIIRREYAE